MPEFVGLWIWIEAIAPIWCNMPAFRNLTEKVVCAYGIHSGQNFGMYGQADENAVSVRSIS